MSKQAEIDYFGQMSEQARDFVRRKPFSADQRGAYLLDMGQLLTVIRKPPARLLDLGCGSGWTSAMFALSGYEVLGVDIAPAAIKLAGDINAGSGARFSVCDFEALPFQNEFDIAILYDCLHHAESPGAVISQVFKALKPGGEIAVVEPGKGHHMSTTAQQAIRECGVTERDMPPALTRKLLMEADFRQIRTFPRVQYQLHEPEPTGRVAGLVSRLLGRSIAALAKNLKNSIMPGINGIVTAQKQA
ncbi:MAG: class I SAM-dependent methyltransferase [bacterium]